MIHDIIEVTKGNDGLTQKIRFFQGQCQRYINKFQVSCWYYFQRFTKKINHDVNCKKGMDKRFITGWQLISIL